MLHLMHLRIQNIRSYGEEPVTIDFSPGISLFSGDIGSGKSTILSAIEFGLFGLGDVKSTHLLRHHQKRGEVSLTFITGEEEYTINRTLVRTKKGVNQGPCSLTGPNGEEAYAPADLKPKVLAILGFHEQPDPKATSRIFRYAIYTPQEAMKAVLSMKEEQRLDILRRAFGIEQYRWAATNTEEAVIRQWLNTEIEICTRLCTGLEEDERQYEEVLLGCQQARAGVAEQAALLETLTGAVTRTDEAIATLLPFQEKAGTLRGSLPGLTSAREARQAQRQGLLDEEKRIDRDLVLIAGDEEALVRLMPKYLHLQEQKQVIVPLEERYLHHRDLQGREAALTARIRAEEEHLKERAGRCQRDRERAQAIHDERQNLIRQQQTISAALKPLEAAVAQLPEMTARVNTLVQGRERIRVERDTQERTLKTLKTEWEQIAAIGEGATCPQCQQTLTREHQVTMEQETQAKADEIQGWQRDLAGLLKEADDMISGARIEQAALEEEQRTCNRQKTELAGITARIGGLLEEEERLGTAVDEERKIREALTTGTFALDLQQQRQEVTSAIEALTDEVARYIQAKETIRALEEEQVERTCSTLNARIATKQGLLERRSANAEAIRSVETDILGLDKAIRTGEQALADAEVKLRELLDLETTAARQRDVIREQQQVLDQLQREVEHLTRTCDDLKRVILEKRGKAGTMQVFQEQRRWLRDHFLPAVESIERSRLAQINETFNCFFQQWFTDLIAAEEISVRVDDAFTPLVEQDGFEVDADSLSGGERTSLALAYRLALNTIVRDEIGADQKSLLILDEPTDGFSAGQLYRLRDILLDAGCDQLIMVSHEKELEGFVDTLYRVTKVDGISSVVRR
jgi:exonuclease SbcC